MRISILINCLMLVFVKGSSTSTSTIPIVTTSQQNEARPLLNQPLADETRIKFQQFIQKQEEDKQTVTYPPSLDWLSFEGVDGYYACNLGAFGPKQEIRQFYLTDQKIECRDKYVKIMYAFNNNKHSRTATVGYIGEEKGCIGIRQEKNKHCIYIKK